MLEVETHPKSSARKFHLNSHDIHVWKVSLLLFENYYHTFLGTLSNDELIRANQFVYKKDHIQYVLARGILRDILSRYLLKEPKSIQFNYGTYGKPYLDLTYRWLNFNVSHSGNMALYAIAKNAQIGIDIEKYHEIDSYECIAKDYFSEQEYCAIMNIPLSERLSAFFTLWTKKESILKALGYGLSYALDKFHVTLSELSDAVKISSINSPNQTLKLFVKSLHIDKGYSAALACDVNPYQISHFKYN